MLESLLHNDGAIGRDEVELLGCALIEKFIVIVGRRGFFTGPATFRAHFSFFLPDIEHGLGSLLDELEGEITL